MKARIAQHHDYNKYRGNNNGSKHENKDHNPFDNLARDRAAIQEAKKNSSNSVFGAATPGAVAIPKPKEGGLLNLARMSLGPQTPSAKDETPVNKENSVGLLTSQCSSVSLGGALGGLSRLATKTPKNLITPRSDLDTVSSTPADKDGESSNLVFGMSQSGSQADFTHDSPSGDFSALPTVYRRSNTPTPRLSESNEQGRKNMPSLDRAAALREREPGTFFIFFFKFQSFLLIFDVFLSKSLSFVKKFNFLF